jgi:hypothetical protein
MSTIELIATKQYTESASSQNDHQSALKFITCGSVDDGKSTLIGRLLLDSKSVLQDQLANVSKSGEADLAQFTDGLSAEREQGITIDVAYRYFNTARRKFIIGDAHRGTNNTRATWSLPPAVRMLLWYWSTPPNCNGNNSACGTAATNPPSFTLLANLLRVHEHCVCHEQA